MRRIKAIIASWPILSFCAAVALSLSGLWGFTAWWYSFPPKRPADVSPDAVFIWAPGVGLPAPKHGDWVNCWYEAKRDEDQCRQVAVPTGDEYEGAFLPYEGKGPIRARNPEVDARATTEHQAGVWTGRQFALLVYLRNGDVLIRTAAYPAGRAQVDEDRWLTADLSPQRPDKVPADPVYVPWTLGNAYGMWLRCWLGAERKVDVCRAVATDGQPYYEGAYLPDNGLDPVPKTALVIDAKATWENKLDSSVILTRAEASSPTAPPRLPFIYLQNGAILIPTVHYEAERKWLEKWRRMQPSLKRTERAWQKSGWW